AAGTAATSAHDNTLSLHAALPISNGGAEMFAAAIAEIRRRRPGTSVEVLIPDFKGSERALRIVVDATPDILNHNLETIERLYRLDRKSTRLNSSHEWISYAVFCLK